MSLCSKYYPSILIASLLSGWSLLAPLSVLADQHSLTPGKLVENQVTAQFTNVLDGTDRQIISDKVTITVAEVTGIAANNVEVLPIETGRADDD
jgi:hypothetical protein